MSPKILIAVCAGAACLTVGFLTPPVAAAQDPTAVNLSAAATDSSVTVTVQNGTGGFLFCYYRGYRSPETPDPIPEGGPDSDIDPDADFQGQLVTANAPTIVFTSTNVADGSYRIFWSCQDQIYVSEGIDVWATEPYAAYMRTVPLTSVVTKSPIPVTVGQQCAGSVCLPPEIGNLLGQ